MQSFEFASSRQQESKVDATVLGVVRRYIALCIRQGPPLSKSRETEERVGAVCIQKGFQAGLCIPQCPKNRQRALGRKLVVVAKPSPRCDRRAVGMAFDKNGF